MFSNWVAVTFFGAWFNVANHMIVKKISMREDVNLILAMAMCVGGILLALYYFSAQKGKWVLDGSMFIWAALMGLALALIFTFFARAVALGPLSLVSPLFGAILNVTVVILGILVFAEKVSTVSAAGIVLTIAGTFMIAKG
ncbi:MAG: hypothetical protein COY40_05855 [Alphaproteobacteria bacterium CG_4_10_14_0_8_um_filter_53_9]|nr:MAG: hypothetical protein COY40_05855 [Alphaproteobacteria bacterium CG_4_10_14_0_8_um_filter_53_9]